MSYIGQRPVVGRYIKLDQISSGFNGSNTGFSMTAGSQAVFPGTARNLLLSLGGVIQEPDTDFTISGSTLTFTTPPVANTTFFGVIYGDMQATGTPSDGTVLPASIASSGNFSFPEVTVTGDVNIADSIIHSGDTDTKIRFPAANQISFETTGSEAVRIDESGRLGIGHDNPSQLLTVRGNAPIIRIEENQSGGSKRLDLGVTNSGAVGYIGANQSASSLAFQTTNNERMRITSAGLVGIGTTSPAALLNLDVDTEANLGSGSEGIRLTSGSSNAQLVRLGSSYSNNSVTGPGTLLYSSNKLSIRCDNSNPITFHTGSTVAERMRIDSSGKVGIGEDAPQQKLHLHEASSNGNFMVFTNSTTGATGNDGVLFGINSDEGGTIWNQENTYIRFGTNDTERIRIDSSGNVGIGTTSPSRKLEINSGIFDVVAKFVSSDSAATINLVDGLNADGVSIGSINGNMTFRSGLSTERMRIDTSGRVLIGTTTEGTVDSDDLTIATSGNTGMTIRSGTTSNGAIHFSDATSGAGEYAGYIDYDHNVDKFDMGNNSGRFLSSDSNRVVSIGNASFGGSSGVIGYGSTGGVRKDSILALNASATVAGRGAGVSVGGNSSALGSFYCNKAGNADSDGGNVFLESVGALRFLTGGANDRAIIDSSGKVGIGTTSPEGSGLDVTSSRTNAYSTTADQRNLAHIIVRNHSDNAGRFASISLVSGGGTQAEGSINLIQTGNYAGDLAFKLRNGSGSNDWQEYMRILSNGVVDIYSAYTNPVGGTTRDLYVRSDGRLGYLSSIRASKTNIVDLTDISWLNNLKPKAFNIRKKNDSGEYTDNYYNELEYGLIAEDVESVNKELCSYSSDNALEAVQYRKLVVPLLKAVQELTARVAALEAA